ncbi:hypothetical protein QS257_21520 [Terrilactibacillus sp. S3-3]|nr:hypothetical protein QS257_21520 [Terrilactibacillus sp. S3-3]
MSKYIILTNKDEFQTMLDNEGLKPIETYEFHFFNHIKAKYTIAKVLDDTIKIVIYEKDKEKEYINRIRVKFFQDFESVEAAREELFEIVKASGNSDHSKYAKLVKSPAAV